MQLKQVGRTIEQECGRIESLFLACSSYEFRCRGVTERLSESYRSEHVALFVSGEYKDKGQNPVNFRWLEERLARHSDESLTPFEFAIDNPASSLDQFHHQMLEWLRDGRFDRVTIDISTFPRQEMLVLLNYLDRSECCAEIRIFYSEPGEYSTEQKDGWLTSGVKSVVSVYGFPGVQSPGKDTLLIMFLGHESERAAVTHKRHQPKKTLVVAPDQNYRHRLDGIVRETHPLLFSLYDKIEVTESISARGVDEARQTVLQAWERYHNDYSLVIAPLGTKLQTIGIYQAVREKKDIQITYAVPVLYNFDAYSGGIGPIWELRLQRVGINQ